MTTQRLTHIIFALGACACTCTATCASPPRVDVAPLATPLSASLSSIEATDLQVPLLGGQMTLERFEIDAAIDAGGVARVDLTVVVRGAASRTNEARLILPLPEGAAVTRLALDVDGAWREGTLTGGAKARETYDAIVGNRRDPALLEPLEDGLYRLSVFPVPPGAARAVTLRYYAAADEGLTQPPPRLADASTAYIDALDVKLSAPQREEVHHSASAWLPQPITFAVSGTVAHGSDADHLLAARGADPAADTGVLTPGHAMIVLETDADHARFDIPLPKAPPAGARAAVPDDLEATPRPVNTQRAAPGLRRRSFPSSKGGGIVIVEQPFAFDGARVRLLRAKIMGSMDRAIIRRITEHRLEQLPGCFARAAWGGGPRRGELRVKYIIQPNGLVPIHGIRTVGGTLKDDEGRGVCVTAALIGLSDDDMRRIADPTRATPVELGLLIDFDLRAGADARALKRFEGARSAFATRTTYERLGLFALPSVRQRFPADYISLAGVALTDETLREDVLMGLAPLTASPARGEVIALMLAHSPGPSCSAYILSTIFGAVGLPEDAARLIEAWSPSLDARALDRALLTEGMAQRHPALVITHFSALDPQKTYVARSFIEAFARASTNPAVTTTPAHLQTLERVCVAAAPDADSCVSGLRALYAGLNAPPARLDDHREARLERLKLLRAVLPHHQPWREELVTHLRAAGREAEASAVEGEVVVW